jgi:hypothetical protein
MRTRMGRGTLARRPPRQRAPAKVGAMWVRSSLPPRLGASLRSGAKEGSRGTPERPQPSATLSEGASAARVSPVKNHEHDPGIAENNHEHDRPPRGHPSHLAHDPNWEGRGSGRGESQGAVARTTGHGRKTIRGYVRTARSLGWEVGSEPPSEELAAVVFERHRPTGDGSPGAVEADLLGNLETISGWLEPPPGG